jgi:Zn-dependent metalloprotease
MLLPLLPATLLTAPKPPDAGVVAVNLLKHYQAALGLDQRNSFGVNGVMPDKVLNRVVVRITQYYQGVPVLGGEAIMQMRGEQMEGFTDKFKRHFNLDVKPCLTPSEALALAVKDLAPKGPFVVPPTTELVVARMKLGPGAPTLRDALVYHVHTELENGTAETAHTDYLIDAHTAAIAKKWSTLHTASADGVGHSQFSGKVTIKTNTTATGFELRDLTRGDSGNTVVDLNHGTGDSGGAIFTSPDNVWGDGGNYAGGATSSVNGQTAAVDAAYGSQWTWDYYKAIHGRNGIDGNGTATSMRVHYSNAYDNAFWSDSCFCMTFGDGSRFKSLEAIDVMGHEMSHGVCAATAALQYYGESGGLNEANSDIHGTMVEFYSRGGHDAVIGDQGGNWTMGEQLETSSFPRPLRYMYKPSLDGNSPDAWYSGIENLDVHNSSGPMNRCFYFLSQGASATAASDFNSAYLPGGMTGLGNDRSARIWYRAMTTYMTSSADYAEARQDAISAARDLYGKGGPEEQAVWNAFAAINVGKPWPKQPPAAVVKATITAPTGPLAVPNGTTVSFVGSATDSRADATLSYAWTFGDGGIATGAMASHTFVNAGTRNLTRTVILKATDDSGATDSATLAITVTPGQPPAPAGPDAILNGGFENGTLHWEGNTEKIGIWAKQPPFAGKRGAWLLGSNQPASEALRQVVVLPIKLKSGTIAFQLHVEAPQGGTTATDSLRVEYANTDGTTTLGTFTNLDAADGYTRHTFALPANPGEMGVLLFRADGTGAAQTSFVLDDVSLVTN